MSIFFGIKDFQTPRELNELISGKARAFEVESFPQSDLKSTCVLVILIQACIPDQHKEKWTGPLEERRVLSGWMYQECL